MRLLEINKFLLSEQLHILKIKYKDVADDLRENNIKLFESFLWQDNCSPFGIYKVNLRPGVWFKLGSNHMPSPLKPITGFSIDSFFKFLNTSASTYCSDFVDVKDTESLL